MVSFYPDTRIFKAALWDYLTNSLELIEPINFSQQHPKKANEIQNGKTRIVLSPASNYGFGEKLTRQISAPTIRFTAYATREASCDASIQKLIEVLESWTPERFQMLDQKLDFISPDQKIESLFNEDINLYFGSITYKFYLRR